MVLTVKRCINVCGVKRFPLSRGRLDIVERLVANKFLGTVVAVSIGNAATAFFVLRDRILRSVFDPGLG